MEIIEKSVEKAWKKALKYILDEGIEFIDRRKRLCKEVLNLKITLKDLSDIKKPLEILNSFEKLVYPTIEELREAILNKKEISGYYYHYGERAFNYNRVNQIDDFIIPMLKKDPTSKRAIVVFYGPEKDSIPLKKETPGMILMNFNIRRGKLHSTIVIRSNDLFYGWPANIIQTYSLAEYVAKELNLEIGELTTFSISAHIFEDQFEDIRRVLKM